MKLLSKFLWGIAHLIYILFVLCCALIELEILDNWNQLCNPAFCAAGFAIVVFLVVLELLTPEWPVLLWLSVSLLFPLAAQLITTFFHFLGNPGFAGMLIILVLLTWLIVILFNLFQINTLNENLWPRISIGLIIGVGMAFATGFVMRELQSKYSTEACTYLGSVSPAVTMLITCKVRNWFESKSHPNPNPS